MRRLALAILPLALTACSGGDPTGSPAPPLSLADVQAIEDTVERYGLWADLRRWDEIGALFTDPYTADFTADFGGEPITSPRDVGIANWRSVMDEFDATQHLITNITVEPEGTDAASVRSNVRATHRVGATLWVLSGNYVHHVVRAGERWQIDWVTFRSTHEEGDRHLLQPDAVSGEG